MTLTMAELFSSTQFDPKKPEAVRAGILAAKNNEPLPALGKVSPSPVPDDRDRSGSTSAADAGYALPEPETPGQYDGAAKAPHQGTFGAASADVGLLDEVTDNPFDSPSVEPALVVTPLAPIAPPAAGGSAPAVDDDDDGTPKWHSPEVERLRQELEAERAAKAATSVPDLGDPLAAPPAATYAEDEGDDDDYVRPKKSFLEGLPNPLKVFEKNPKLVRPAAIGAVGVVVAVGAAVIFGGSTASDTPAAPPPVVVEEPPGEDIGTQVTTLLPKEVSASCPPGSTSAAMAFTSKPENAWVCIRAHGIDGAVMNMIFGTTVKVKTITVMPGWNYVAPNGRDHWNEHRLTTKILWRIGGQQFEQVINPSRSGSTLTLPGDGVSTKVMSLTIQETTTPDAVNVNTGPGNEGGLLAPGGDLGPQNSDVDKSTAIGSVIINGTEG